MDSISKMKDFHGNNNTTTNTTTASCSFAAATTISSSGAAMTGICSSDSFSLIPPLPHNDMVSANSIDLNAAASLSDDSGVPLTTNSSISSGDSYRLGMCKFEIEMVESDGEVSQFDSLDNCSEGGMSGENFNTLKKGPLAPIDPPPEFQDSPQTTLVRSISKNLVNSLRRWTSSQSSFEHLKDPSNRENHNSSADTLGNVEDNDEVGDMLPSELSSYDDKTLKESYAINKHMYSSDSILNSHTDNIYDEPNNIISSSLGNSVDALESSDTSSPLPPPPPPVSIVKIKQTLCPFYQDHTRYFKAIPSEQDHNVSSGNAARIFYQTGLSEIHDYDLYYSIKRNTTYHQQYENSLQRKLIYSPINHAHHCHSHHYHTGTNLSGGNRPNSRNSLNSRLSSSHNSLSVSSANKPDDSIFITQAMSHDALLTREISDFYNVPIDSDIYAFPVDMIPSSSDKEDYTKDSKSMMNAQLSDSALEHNSRCPHYKAQHRRNRNKRKKRYSNQSADNIVDEDRHKHSRAMYRAPISASKSTTTNESSNCRLNSDDLASQEPLHMTLDEVKQFYHTLYSDGCKTTAGTALQRLQGNKCTATKSSNETIWSVSSSNRSRNNNNHFNTTRDKNALNSKVKSAKKLCSDNESISNNNNNNISTNHNNQSQVSNNLQTTHNKLQQQTAENQTIQRLSTVGGSGKQTHQHSEKKSQFTLNLKQKFCSIFRFRRNRCRNSSNLDQDEISTNRTENSQQSAEDKRKKFQSRALPPLPNKAEVNSGETEEKTVKEFEPTTRPFQFTSSIEKVKDYGWYWGPLSSEAAEKVLSNEPDGSFIVRDSSDDHYIFSLSFKLNNCVRHVRIEQDQGTFSFGSYAKFKSQTITEFIEKAVEHSRSGRYLFFLHRRPEHGPMRVQLTNPVSRFKHVQSLQHMCRFVILKAVIRKDLIQTLPLPRRLLDYLNYKHCYSEQVESDSSHSQISGDASS